MKICVECYADEKLVASLEPEYAKRILHHGGKGDIVNYLRKASTEAGIGLVDEDPGSTQPRDFRANYIEIERSGAIRYYRHREKSSCFIIMLCPRLEEWLLARAKAAGIDRAAYGLPDTGKSLHEIMHYERRPEFKEFLERLFNSGDVEVEKLRGWIANSLFDELL
jgi:hypothetical protein